MNHQSLQLQTLFEIKRELEFTGHTCHTDVTVAGLLSLIAKMPGEPSFAVAVGWLPDASLEFRIDDKQRAALEVLFCRPVHFVVGIGKKIDVLRVEPFLAPKLLFSEPFMEVTVEILAPDGLLPLSEYAVVDQFKIGPKKYEIIMDRVGGQFRLSVRRKGGDLVDGFEFRTQAINNISLKDAYYHSAIARQAQCLEELVRNEHWEGFVNLSLQDG